MKTAHDVKLLNGSKQEVSYTGVETVTMPGTDGQDKVFTAGTPIDALDISPDFSGGDMPLEAPDGYVVRSAIIKKPEGAEQAIAKGKTLAGITGEYVTPGTAKEIILDFSAGSETDYLPQLTGTTALDDTYGYFIRVNGGTLLTVGDTYLVSWDGTAYTCIAQDASILMDGAVCLGNATALGLSGDDEPFCAAYLQGGFSVVSLTDTAPTEHTVRIYQLSEDQTVTAEGDERWSEVTVKKPEGLVPENIAEGINISGVIGSLSKSVKVAIGKVDYSTSYGTIYHNLGVVPDIVLMSVSSNSNNTQGIRLQFGVSSAFRAKYPGVYSILVNKIGTSNNSYTQVETSTSWTVDGTSVYCIYGADETKFKFGYSPNFSYSYVNGNKVWVAIGGLT